MTSWVTRARPRINQTPTSTCREERRALGRAQKLEEALQAQAQVVEQPPEPTETVPTWAIAPAVLEVQAALDHRDVDASTTTARLVLDQITATGTDTAAEKLAVSALASATGRGKDRPVQALIERDVAVEHRKATHAHLTERYGRAPPAHHARRRSPTAPDRPRDPRARSPDTAPGGGQLHREGRHGPVRSDHPAGTLTGTAPEQRPGHRGPGNRPATAASKAQSDPRDRRRRGRHPEATASAKGLTTVAVRWRTNETRRR